MSAQGWVIVLLVVALVLALTFAEFHRSMNKINRDAYREADAGWQRALEGWRQAGEATQRAIAHWQETIDGWEKSLERERAASDRWRSLS